MIYVLIIIAILLLLILRQLGSLNSNFVKWATEDITYKSHSLRNNPTPPRKR